MNTCFLITDKGILNTSTSKNYFPDRKFFHSEWNHGNGNGWSTDDIVKTYMDKNDNLWFMFQHGEWGDDLLIFNTLNNNFCDYTKETAMPFFEYNNHIYGSTSSLFGLYVIQYDKKINSDGKYLYNGEMVYDEEHDYSIPRIQGHVNNLTASAFTYNDFNGMLYIVCSSGLRMASPLKPHSQFGDWRPVQKLHLPNLIVTTINEYFSNKKDADTSINPDNERFINNHYNRKIVAKLGRPEEEYFSKIQFTPKGNLVLLSPFNGFCLLTKNKLIKLE